MTLVDAMSLGNKKLSGEIDMTWAEIGAKCDIDPDRIKELVCLGTTNDVDKEKKTVPNTEKILIFSDCHVPDHHEDLILNIVKDFNDVSTIIIAGDLIDCKAVSAWYDEFITILDHEMLEAYLLLKKIRELTDAKIILVKGNHEARVNTEYAKNAKRLGTSLVETEILYKLANGFEIKTRDERRIEYKPIENVSYCGARSYLLGDLLINHPSTFRKDYLKTVSIMYSERFKQKYTDANVFLIGHTHQLGMAFVEDGKVLIESGCTCKPASYADKDDKPFKIQQYGAVTLNMINNKVDINSISLHYYGSDNSDITKEEDSILDEI